MPRARRGMLAAVFLPALFSLTSCGRHVPAGQDKTTEAMVRVGPASFSREDLERFFEARISDVKDSSPADEVKSALLDSFVEEKLLLAKAELEHVTPSSQALDSLRTRMSLGGAGTRPDLARDGDLEKSLTESLKIQQYLHEFLFKGLSVSRAECEAYYREHPDEFVRDDVVHVREILVDSPELATRIQAALKAKRNRNFAELARQYSKAPSAAQGGDMGTFQRGDLPEEFERVVFLLAPNTVSKPVNTQYGYHLFLVDEKIAAHQQHFYEVESQIHEKLLLDRQRAALDRELASLTEQIPVEVNHEKLGFRYTGIRSASPRGIPK